MNELLQAAKDMVEWFNSATAEDAPVDNLRAAVERAESDDEIDRENQEAMNIHLSGVMAERERIKEIVGKLSTPKDPWIHYETLLEKIDATTE